MEHISKYIPKSPRRSTECQPRTESGLVFFYADRSPLAVEECTDDGVLFRVNYYDNAKIAEDDIIRNDKDILSIERLYFSGEIILAIDTLAKNGTLLKRLDCIKANCPYQPHNNHSRPQDSAPLPVTYLPSTGYYAK